MIKKYIFGKPMNTGAVSQKLSAEEGSLPVFGTDISENKINLTCPLSERDIVYGLGEANRGINKRGWHYEAKNSDDPVHTENKTALYGAHNFVAVSGCEHFGIFIDTPAYIHFDIGYSDPDVMSIDIHSPDAVIYFIAADDISTVVREFRQLIGKSYIPPLWAFGYQQSRWGYQSAEDIRNVVENHRSAGIPLDAVYMDIDYMDGYRDFTVDNVKFPEFDKFVSEMKENNIHLVPIIDAGVKIDENYDVYREGVENGYFCKRADGSNFVAGVWPGRTHFPDFFMPEARKWFGEKYRRLTDLGIDGFWNDMNEPAIFYSEEGLKEAMEHVDRLKGENLGIDSFFELTGTVAGISNNVKDYDHFYHTVDGEKIPHSKLHNLYGMNMTKAAAEAFERFDPTKRMLMLSRSSYIGMHRYSGIWTGDNCSWWSHLLLNIKQMPSLNMCGFLYTGADVGGFGNDTTPDLLMRWLEFAVFTPLMRNHSAAGTRDQEVYRFRNSAAFANIIRLRYRLIPYLYSEFVKSVLNDDMYFRPLAFDFPDDSIAVGVEDQLMVGNSVMIAPVYEQNARGRIVYLPEEMLRVKYLPDGSYETRVMPKGHSYVSAELDEVVFFIRKGHFIPLADSANSTAELNMKKLTLLGYLDYKANYLMYSDDGESKDYYDQNNYITLTVIKDNRDISVRSSDPDVELAADIK